jgi:N-acetylglutamate synthase-like GNAT family acetyltransferase
MTSWKSPFHKGGPRGIRIAVIRRFREADANAVSRIIIDNLTRINVRDYGEPAVKQLARFYSPQKLLAYALNDQIYVALDDSGITGTVALDQDRVRNLFVKMDRQQQGIGTLLMHHSEDIARQEGRSSVFLHANVSAVDFYLKLGYSKEKVIEENIGGTAIKMIVMKKSLADIRRSHP